MFVIVADFLTLAYIA